VAKNAALAVPLTTKRPEFKGDKSIKIKVVSNHYNISFKGGSVYQWFAEFEPELAEDSREVINRVFNSNRKEIYQRIGKTVRAVNTVFSFAKPPVEKISVFNKDFELYKDKGYKLTLKRLDRVLNMDNIFAQFDEKFEIMRVVNICIKQMMAANKYREFGIDRKFYDPTPKSLETESIGDFVLNFMKGFKTTIDMYQGGVPKILIDSSTRIIRGYNLWEEYLYFRDEMGMSDENIIHEYIQGRSFLTSYGNQRIYRIDYLDPDVKLSSKFPNDKFSSYSDYYTKQYGVTPVHKNQFLVVSIRKRKELDKDGKIVVREEKIHLVPELLLPTGMTDSMRSDPKTMQQVAKYTQLMPHERDNKQSALVAALNKTENELGLKIDPNSNIIKDALIYKPPKITLSKESCPERGNFIIKEPIYGKGAQLKKWVIICEEGSQELAQKLAVSMKKASSALKIVVDKPHIEAISSSHSGPKRGGKRGGHGGGSNKVSADDVIAAIERLQDASIFLLFFPKRIADRIYDKVKIVCNSQLGVFTQFFSNWNDRFLKNIDNMSVTSKLVMQMVCKLGVPLWKVEKPYKLNTNGLQTMIIGADLFHQGVHETVVSVCSTMDKDFTEYYCVNDVQKRKSDYVMNTVSKLVIDCVEQYSIVNNVSPDMIMFYRDGIGMGQYNEVREIEIKAILQGLQESFGDKAPKLAYIVLTKRINDRFFEQGNRGLSNPSGGLIIQSQVVSDSIFDFYMVAQCVNRGTATPTHYEVLYNNTPLLADSFYQATYYQCYNYYNWSGPVKVPSVVQYANKQAYLVGKTRKFNKKEYDKVDIEDKQKLRKTLYFL